MRPSLLALALFVTGTPAAGQVTFELTYGIDRNVESVPAELDGALTAILEWNVFPGLDLGVGTDHQFEGPAISPAGHQGWALFVSVSHRFEAGRVDPFLRGGLGAGRAPCEGDTCSGGVYLRGSLGARILLTGPVNLTAEVGLTRVSRPIAGIGLSFRPAG